MELNDKVVLVTGGHSGLGKAVVDYFYARKARIVIFDMAEASEVADDSGVKIFSVDVRDFNRVKKSVDEVTQLFGRLDIVVNCAGVAPAQKVLDRDGRANPVVDFSRVVDINLFGTFNVCAAAAEKMALNTPCENGERGVIINTASVAAYEGQKGQCAYAASKGAIVSMTLPMARELGAVGIRAVAIAPGVMATPMMLAMPERVKDSLAESVPFPKRFGLPEEFAALAAHIVKNHYINGEVIRLDGALRMS